MNPSVWCLKSNQDPIFIATTDYPFVQRFDINTLETLELMRPTYGMEALSGITHWHREVDTNNSIYLMGRMGGLLSSNVVEIQRYSAENPDHAKFSNPEVIASIDMKKNSIVHSFSVTENYAILFYYPVVYDIPCLIMNNFHIMDCIKELKDEHTDIYIVNLKTNDVKELSAKTLFSMHHINAYETNDGHEIVLDMSPVDPMFMKEYPLLKKMMNPPEYSKNTVLLNDEITRYHIDLQTEAVTELRFPNLLKNATTSRYANNFDLGVINEAYRGQKVGLSKYV